LSRWLGKYVIGLTGNIATGKSVVRKMLEHLGAYGIDADALAHRAVAKGAPGYSLVVKAFGEWVLDAEGHIDRPRLARLVFLDPEALERLESIVHPLVTYAIDLLIRRAKQEVIVIEAIKLLESGLAASCDAIWVAHASEKMQTSRLMQKRNMTKATAQQRISAQPAQELKLRAANVIIHNDGDFDATWEQVEKAWMDLPMAKEPLLEAPLPIRPGQIRVRRGKPQDAEEIARFITRVTQGKRKMSRQDVMAAFGEKAYLLIDVDQELSGLTGWQVENLVTCIDEIYFDPKLPLPLAIPALMDAVESLSGELQSEAALLFLPPLLARHAAAWRSVGYQPMTLKGLGVRAWQEAAIESMPRGASLWFKRLREDRVLRPM
jgi:dephospho-CoA kinase